MGFECTLSRKAKSCVVLFGKTGCKTGLFSLFYGKIVGIRADTKVSLDVSELTFVANT